MAKTKPKLFRVRLESPDLTRDDGTPEFRLTLLAAADAAAARRICERKELKIAAKEYPEGTLAELERVEKEALDADTRVPAQTRMQLATHRQERPYEVVDVEEAS